MEELTRYIHLNPVRAKIVKIPELHKWSSYKYYVLSKRNPEYLKTELTLSFFSKKKEEYKKFVKEGILSDIENPLEKVKVGLILEMNNL